MLLPAPPLYPRKRKPRAKRRTVATPTAPVLVSVTYEPTAAVTLTFNRAIDIAGINLTTILVADGPNGFLYEGAGTPVQGDPASVQIDLNGIEEITADDVKLTAWPTNGIVGAGDGLPWDGVVDLVLPFP